MMDNKYSNLIVNLEPFIVTANPELLGRQQEIMGKQMRDELRFDPLKTSSKNFIKKLHQLDDLSFAQQGMGMEPWVFLDCGFLPGYAFGFCIKGNNLSKGDREFLKMSSEEYFPVSMYIAIPTADKTVWFGHNLSSLNVKLETPLKGLGFLTKREALSYARTYILRGATQWDSKALYLHLKFGPLKILSALTPAHSVEESLVYECHFENYETVKSNKETLELELNSKNLLDLQKRIENGEKFYLLNKEFDKLILCID